MEMPREAISGAAVGDEVTVRGTCASEYLYHGPIVRRITMAIGLFVVIFGAAQPALALDPCLALGVTVNRETVEVETSRVALASLDLKVGDLVNLRLRQAHSFENDYTI